MERHSDEMLSLLLLLSIVSPCIALVEYNGKIVNESLVVFENRIFYLDISRSGDDNVMYLNIDKQIVEDDKLYLNVMTERFDGAQFPISDSPVLLCDLLEKESADQDSIWSKLRFSRVLNMEGMHCPIPAGKKKLMPYMFPPNVMLYNDIGCGQFDYKIAIEQCNNEGEPRDCAPMIYATPTIDMQTEHCSNVLI